MELFDATRLVEGDKVWLVEVTPPIVKVHEAVIRKSDYGQLGLILSTYVQVDIDSKRSGTEEETDKFKIFPEYFIESEKPLDDNIIFVPDDFKCVNHPFIHSCKAREFFVKWGPETDSCAKVFSVGLDHILELALQYIAENVIFYTDANGQPTEIFQCTTDGTTITGVDTDGQTHKIYLGQCKSQAYTNRHYNCMKENSYYARERRLLESLRRKFGLLEAYDINGTDLNPKRQTVTLTLDQFYNYINGLWQDPELLSQAGSAAVQRLFESNQSS